MNLRNGSCVNMKNEKLILQNNRFSQHISLHIYCFSFSSFIILIITSSLTHSQPFSCTVLQYLKV